MTKIGNKTVLEMGRTLEALTRKIRRHQGQLTTLEWKIIRLKIEWCMGEIDVLLGEPAPKPKNLKSGRLPLLRTEVVRDAQTGEEIA